MTSQRITGVVRVQVPLQVRDLSLSGAHLVVKAYVEKGSTHDFMLDLGGSPFLAKGRIVRCDPVASGTGHDIAIEFTAMEGRDRDRLSEYLERTRPRS